jgi:hypothetical protein
MSMDKQFVFKQIKNIIADYPIMECDRCAVAISDWLKKNGISYKILKLKTKRRSDCFIVSVRYGINNTITENGTHYAVEVYQLVFDNLSEYGLSREEWIADFNCRSGQFIIEELDSMEV